MDQFQSYWQLLRRYIWLQRITVGMAFISAASVVVSYFTNSPMLALLNFACAIVLVRLVFRQRKIAKEIQRRLN